MEITPVILDGVKELITMGVGRAAGMLNQLTGAHVSLHVPDVQIIETTSECIQTVSQKSSSQVSLNYAGLLTGSTVLIIPHASALNLVTILTGEEQTMAEMDALRVETLLEVGNIIISALMCSFSTLMDTRLAFQFPAYHAGTTNSIIEQAMSNQYGVCIAAQITFEVQKRRIEGDLILLLTSDSLDNLKHRILFLIKEEE
jgi:chemotaxis protein CheC